MSFADKNKEEQYNNMCQFLRINIGNGIRG